MKRIIEWYKQSNRYLHALLGAYITISVIVINLIGFDMPFDAALHNAGLTTLLVMAGVELKDRQTGNLFDWRDILAGMTAPGIGFLIYLIYSLIVLLFA